jgi:hypothetical protein
MRNGETGCSIISSRITGCFNPNSYLRKLGAEYFRDAPEVVAKIDDKTYTWETIIEMVSDYNKLKKGVSPAP